MPSTPVTDRPSHPSTHRPRSLATRLCALTAALAAILACALPAEAHTARATDTARVAAHATKLVTYGTWHARVPRSWPVYRLSRDPRACVRFDRHAVYLGRPSGSERCPAHAAGRTEAILVSPAPRAGADTLAAGTLAPAGGPVAQVRRAGGRVLVTATWSHDPAVVRSALGVRSLTAAARAYRRAETMSLHRLARAGTADGARANATTTPSAPATTGEVYNGLGFDACSAPSTTAMSAWLSSPFRAVGIYIGGPEMACAQTNLTAAWVSAETAAGWHLIPIYVGLQAPTNGCGCASISAASAATQGSQAATSAVQEAQALGLGAGNPIYDDMENYTRTTSASQAVLAYLQGWTQQLHALGYLSGVYSSELSGVEDLVAAQGTGYVEPDELWIANWNGQQSTADAKVPATDWANNQRLHQYRGGHTDDYGGSAINIDSDYVDAATAAPGTGTLTSTIAAAPSLRVRPAGGGAVALTPSWSGETGIARWQILAGSSPSALTAQLSVSAARRAIVTHDGDPYLQVQALSATGQVLGSSGVVATPPHVAVFGHSAFVPAHGPGGLPVACFAISGCRISTTVWLGRRLLVRTSGARVAAGGGIDHFPVSPAVHRLVSRAGNRGLPTTIVVRTTTGRSTKAAIRLVRFTTSGRGPRRRALSSSAGAMRILGGTMFVSHGWTGGVLVACPQPTPCTATPIVRVRGHVVAISRAQTIGPEELGYLSFQMTGAGHRMLMRAPGNQLGATISVTSPAVGLAPAASASAAVSLDAF
ncbi:MAG TPA: DUF1906 domain-containing protein [Solirubrobacteraceae bacterium]|nr:DUF1906 domain-containing protein [Solirubrobacteraceae bacterium]